MRICKVLAALTVLITVAAGWPPPYNSKEQSDGLLKSVVQYLSNAAKTENGLNLDITVKLQNIIMSSPCITADPGVSHMHAYGMEQPNPEIGNKNYS